jgi:hypothetical protein
MACPPHTPLLNILIIAGAYKSILHFVILALIPRNMSLLSSGSYSCEIVKSLARNQRVLQTLSLMRTENCAAVTLLGNVFALCLQHSAFHT